MNSGDEIAKLDLKIPFANKQIKQIDLEKQEQKAIAFVEKDGKIQLELELPALTGVVLVVLDSL
ncbi:MAG: hypothetical protein IJB80_00015 [Clostridia bacterium]|nr:hypothetical protein [Clostridia bacterium]